MIEMQLSAKQKKFSPDQWAAALLIAELKPTNWRDWLYKTFPSYVTADFAPRHVELWEWIDGIQKGDRPRPFVALWPRGGAKSTSAELGVVRVGEKGTRRYVWYISSTQDKADKHVESIAALLESSGAERAVGKYGNSKGWRRERIRTANGLTVDALGLDVGARGAKVEDQRPDMIILDDVDENEDSIATTLKKIGIITKSILPAGSNDCAVLFIQNLIHPESIAARLADGRADFLIDRIVSGPFPAIENLTYRQIDGRFVITSGTATWEGQNLKVCQQQIDTWGLSAFLQEAQHNVERTGGLWDHIEFQHVEWDKLPDFVKVSVWVDPAVTSTDHSDSMGISAGGLDSNDYIYGLYFWEDITSPEDALKRAIRKAIELKSLVVGVETDQGGDTWMSVYARSLDTVKEELEKELSEKKYNSIVWPVFRQEKAGAGFGSKAERNARMLADYERGKVKHAIGTHSTVEKSLRRFPNKPLDLADSWFWTWNDLRSANAPLPDNQPQQTSKWLDSEEKHVGWTRRY